MSKQGRPIKMDAKRDRIHFRLRDDEARMLDELSKHTGHSKTSLFISWLQEAYKQTVETKENLED